MKKLVIPVLVLIIQAAVPLAAEIAVLPYRVEGSSQYLTVEQGTDHAWCVASAAAMTRRVEILPWRDVEEDMKREGLRPDRTISTDDLARFAKKRYLQYIVTGTLERSGKLFRSRSILFSAKEGRIIERSENRAGDLLTLAERDADELFLQFPRIPRKKGGALDVALVFDASLSMVKEWPSLREAAGALASIALEKLMADARVYLVPYSDRVSPADRSVTVRSVAEVDRGLARIRPLGDADGSHLESALRFAVNGIHWREGASHLIIVVANSPAGRGSGAERYSLTAAKKGINLFTITMGALDEDGCSLYRRMAEMGRGQFNSVSYHQRVFDQRGDEQEVYFQRGRFFRSSVYSNEWKAGLLRRESSAGSFGEPLRFLDEIFFREKDLGVNAYNLPDSLNRAEGVVILRSAPLENNLPGLMSRIVEKHGAPAGHSPAGKVLLSDGKINLWIHPSDRAILARLKEYAESGVYISLGCTVRQAPDEAYGITLVPGTVMGPGEYIPAIVRAELADIVSRKSHYMRSGFLDPPIWFVRVKVESLENYGEKYDARD